MTRFFNWVVTTAFWAGGLYLILTYIPGPLGYALLALIFLGYCVLKGLDEVKARERRTWRAPDKKNAGRAMSYRPDTPKGLKPKDLIGPPWSPLLGATLEGRTTDQAPLHRPT
jgi:hypothetical protein